MYLNTCSGRNSEVAGLPGTCVLAAVGRSLHVIIINHSYYLPSSIIATITNMAGI